MYTTDFSNFVFKPLSPAPASAAALWQLKSAFVCDSIAVVSGLACSTSLSTALQRLPYLLSTVLPSAADKLMHLPIFHPWWSASTDVRWWHSILSCTASSTHGVWLYFRLPAWTIQEPCYAVLYNPFPLCQSSLSNIEGNFDLPLVVPVLHNWAS